jgi:hypothetical protein
LYYAAVARASGQFLRQGIIILVAKVTDTYKDALEA